jgi:hypothetical protein
LAGAAGFFAEAAGFLAGADFFAGCFLDMLIGVDDSWF